MLWNYEIMKVRLTTSPVLGKQFIVQVKIFVGVPWTVALNRNDFCVADLVASKKSYLYWKPRYFF